MGEGEGGGRVGGREGGWERGEGRVFLQYTHWSFSMSLCMECLCRDSHLNMAECGNDRMRE